MPESDRRYGFGTCWVSDGLEAERELLRRELVQVDVGHAEVRQLRTQIADLHAPVDRKGLLQGKVPLLRIAALLFPLHREHALSQAAVRIRIRDRHGRTARKHKRRVDVVQRPLAGGLDEWEQRRGERRRDAGLFDPGHAVAGANGEAVGDPEGQSDSRSEVQLLEISRGARVSVLSQESRASASAD